MDNLINLTPFAARAFLSMDRDGDELVVVVVAGRFRLPRAGIAAMQEVARNEQQVPVVVTDQHWGDPAESSLRYEGQSVGFKPGTDVQLNGHAWAARGRPITRGRLAVQVGPARATALVIGDRRWARGLGGLRPTKPEPFDRIPIRHEYSFGGRAGPASARVMAASERNPVGRGLVVSPSESNDRPLPNFEDPDSPIGEQDDLPAPVGFGPVARYWMPRRAYAGTYDEAWVRTRAPLWPKDLDARFFCSAPSGLCVVPHLVGGEAVAIVGAHPDGEIHFTLPRLRLGAKFILQRRTARRHAVLDGVILEPDDGALTMIWRSGLRVGRDLAGIESMIVRLIEPSEEFT